MRSFSRYSLAALLLAVLMFALAGAFFWLHFATPSDGTRLQPGEETVWQMEGVVITPLVDQPPGLQAGDVVIAVDGRSLEDWARAIFRWDIQRPNREVGTTVIYTVMRQGTRLDIPITLIHYPFRVILAKSWGTILFALVSQLIATFVFFRRFNDHAARALFLWASGILSATTWSCGLQVSDLINGTGFWLFKATTFGAYMLFWIAGLHFALVFPRPLPVVSKKPWLIPVLYVAPYMLYPIFLAAAKANAASTLDWIRRWIPGESLLALVYLTLMVLAMLVNYHKNSDPISRQKIRWMMMAALISGGGGILLWILPSLARGHPLISTNALGLLVLPFPIAIGIAIVRHHLFDIDHIFNRALVYGALTAIVGGLYVFVVGFLGTLLHVPAEAHKLADLLLSLVATGIVAVLFQPLRDVVQRSVNRLMYGERDDPYAVLTRLGQRLEGDLATDFVLQAVVETIASTLKLPYAAIALRDGDSPVASFGSAPPEARLRVFPLHYQGELIGELLLAPRAAQEAFTPAEERLLTDLARQAEVAVYNVRLTMDLRQSRERIVTAREEERRRVRRDLHDGLGPLLASQTLTLDALEKLITRDPERAISLLKNMKGQSENAVREIRRIIYDLRPSILDDMGLVEALREGATQLGHSHTAIHLDIEDCLPELSAAMELAVYRISMEALTNVMRHAHARNCYLRLWVNHDLKLEILDDGVGFPKNTLVGVGLYSIRERAEELGGTCLIENDPAGGVRIRVHLPIIRELI